MCNENSDGQYGPDMEPTEGEAAAMYDENLTNEKYKEIQKEKNRVW